MRSVNQKIFFINLIVILAALVVWRATSSIETLSLPSSTTTGSEVKNSLIIGFILLLTLVILFQVYLNRTITKPLRRLAKDMKIRAYSGKLDPVVIEGHDEIAELADLFNSLQKKTKELGRRMSIFYYGRRNINFITMVDETVVSAKSRSAK